MDINSFTIEGKPVPASRPKVARFGVYYPKSHTQREQYLNSVLPTFLGNQSALDEPVEVRILSVIPPYKTSDYPTARCDVDNLSKLPMDCMTKASFWTDDSLVVALTSLKRFARPGEDPHTKIRIIKIEGTVEDHADRLFDA
jgi:Holliday junction resolvase RusA-like endonuclease